MTRSGQEEVTNAVASLFGLKMDIKEKRGVDEGLYERPADLARIPSSRKETALEPGQAAFHISGNLLGISKM